MANKLNLRDNMHMNDKVGNSHPKSLWKKTEIIGGYGLYTDDKGISQLKEVVFSTENLVPLGGVQYAMESIFGVKGPVTVPTLNDAYGIGAIGSTIAPSGGLPYAYGQKVCLFGIGTGGAAENNLSVLDVKYNENNIVDMVPFRYTNEYLASSDQGKYYGKKNVDGIQAYFLKAFDQDAVIRHLYKNGEEGEDGSEVDSSIWDSTSEIGIESFVEMQLTISKKDVREWFEAQGNIEECRVNSIGLYTAVYDATLKDYANIQLFSKLNIPTEPLALTKDMNIIYRVYGA